MDGTGQKKTGTSKSILTLAVKVKLILWVLKSPGWLIKRTTWMYVKYKLSLKVQDLARFDQIVRVLEGKGQAI